MVCGDLRMAAREDDTSRLMGLSEHLDDTTVLTRELQVIKVLKVRGLDPSTITDESLLSRYRLLASAVKNLACEGVALKVYTVKRRAPIDRSEAPTVSTLCMTERYHDLLESRGTYRIDIFLAIEKNARGLESALLSKLRRPSLEAVAADVDSVKGEIDRFAEGLATSLDAFGIRPLAVKRSGGRSYSEIARFFNYLLETRMRKIEIGKIPLSSRMGMARIVYPHLDHIEFRLPAEIVYGAMLGVAEYPDIVDADVLVQLLWTPAEFVACAAWRYVSREFALEQVRHQRRKLVASEDDSHSQMGEIASMLDDAVAGRTLLGRCWFAVLALGRGTSPSRGMLQLTKGVGRIERALNDRGFAIAREDLAIACSHWSMFPGCWRYAPRVVTLTNRNFAALASLQNSSEGSKSTPWGGHLGFLETPFGVPHRLSLHTSDVGNTFVAGPTGSGKTVLLGWLAAHAHASGANVVVFDKDRGTHLAITGLGGTYVAFQPGVATGMNPVASTNDPTFLRSFVELLLRPGGGVPADTGELESAVRAVLSIQPEKRRLRYVADALDPAGNWFQSLRKWIRQGEFAWVFDNGADELVMGESAGLYGFDITAFLDSDDLRAPVLRYLFHRIDQLLGGAPTLIVVDEFWRVLGDPRFSRYVRDRLNTIRKLNGAIVLATQNLSDIVDSDIGRTVVEQTPTKVFFGNRAGRDEEYMGAFGLNDRESEIVRNLPTRSFLFRRGGESRVCRLDLEGLEDIVRLLSGRSATLQQFDQVSTALSQRSRTEVALAIANSKGDFTNETDNNFDGKHIVRGSVRDGSR